MSVLMLLAPSKTMDFTTPLPYDVAIGTPPFLEAAAQISRRLQTYSVNRTAKLMTVSQPIAEAVVDKYLAWDYEAPGRPALWTYTGDVYKGMKAQQMDAASAAWAQQHLLILSGLYGLLRPYDGIQAYRLEMKTALRLGRARNLYEFWDDQLATYVTKQGSDWLCNLSSDEYAKPVLRHVPKDLPVITPVFLDTKPNGVVGTVPIYSKMMRGVLCRWMIAERVTTPQQLQQFAGHNYQYDADWSQVGRPAFSRKIMKPLLF